MTSIPEHEASPVVVRDVFPALATVGGATYASSRAVVTRERVYVFTGAGRDRILVLDEPYLAAQSTVPRYNEPPRNPTHLRLADGRTLTITRQRGCACGSPLKAWRPWNPYRVAQA